ncbi:MAG: PIN domain nuclease [bacterium]|nr:PIN domain nuclease [bacterium]
MSFEFVSRILGMFFFSLVGARLGSAAADTLRLPELGVSVILALVGALFGLILTPILTVRPLRRARRAISEQPIEVLFTAGLGLLLGLLIALLTTYPLSLLDPPLGRLIPPAMVVVMAYLFTVIFSARSREVWQFLYEWLGIGKARSFYGSGGDRTLLLDTSVLIDGRIVDIARTGFIGGTLVVPRFVVSELHRVADSSDPQRRSRGRRGLSKLNELQREPNLLFKITEDDVDDVPEVDDKLVVLAQKTNALILTIDYPLNQVARAQNVEVLNINALANAVRSVYIPGESFAIRVIQEGKEANQGVGYLEDGTMVIIENGKQYMDRTIYVNVTKLINKDTGRILFAMPEKQ